MEERRAGIVEVALELAEDKGLAAVSMRAVATRVGLTPMALYRYVRGKEDLLDGLLGRVLAQVPVPDPGLDWRERLCEAARGVRAVAHRYPRTFPLLLTRPAVLPEAVRMIDPLYAALLDAGVPAARVGELERMFSTYVLGFAVSEVSGRFGPGTRGPRERREDAGPKELPAHHQLGSALDRSPDLDAEFEAGVRRLLDMVDTTAPQGHRGAPPTTRGRSHGSAGRRPPG